MIRKLATARRAKLARVHKRDCPAQESIEIDCAACRYEIRTGKPCPVEGGHECDPNGWDAIPDNERNDET